MTGLATVPIEEGSIDVFFCDKVNCTKAFLNATEGKEPWCAFYSVNSDIKAARLVVDGDEKAAGIKEVGRGLMHNKFCVAGDLVWTGSWNPSQEMSIPNNAVLMKSTTIAQAYRSEFEELNKGTFHGGKKGSASVVLSEIPIEVFFCPEDDCKKALLAVLGSAQSSILFMTYSFTDDDVGKLIEEKARHIEVHGIFDPRMDKRYAEFERLKNVSRVAKVHHKVFIIDDKIVVTGSVNPTKNGFEQNDENMVIIHDENVAKLFTEEFASIT